MYQLKLLRSLKERVGTLKPNTEDRISKYLSMLNKGMLFDELSDNYLRNSGAYDILHGVPVPVLPGEDGELSTLSIALNMAKIIGGDSNYPYTEQYLRYIKFIANDDAAPLLISEGAREADRDNFEVACMYFRAALQIEPKSRDALYLYGRACQSAYEREDNDEDYVGNFKAESLEAFELLTMIHPDFDMGYFFLGYAYLNLGLYTKTKLTWESFLKLHEADDEFREEIEDRIEHLDDPVIIEQGCNKIMSGDYMGGKEMLEPFMEGRYEQWWPLWYHLGVAEESLGNTEAAIQRFKKVLTFVPSNIDVMKELVALYKVLGDETNAEKYSNKIEIVQSNLVEEQVTENATLKMGE